MLLKSYIDYATLRVAKHLCDTSAGTTCTAQVKSMRDTGMMPIRGISLLSTWEQNAKKHKGRGGHRAAGGRQEPRKRDGVQPTSCHHHSITNDRDIVAWLVRL